jgi:hypothetical protein
MRCGLHRRDSRRCPIREDEIDTGHDDSLCFGKKPALVAVGMPYVYE